MKNIFIRKIIDQKFTLGLARNLARDNWRGSGSLEGASASWESSLYGDMGLKKKPDEYLQNNRRKFSKRPQYFFIPVEFIFKVNRSGP